MPPLRPGAVILFSIAVGLYATSVWMFSYITGFVSGMQQRVCRVYGPFGFAIRRSARE